MFTLYIEWEDGEELILDLGSFEDMWEIKDFFEGEGYDVEWEYEPG